MGLERRILPCAPVCQALLLHPLHLCGPKKNMQRMEGVAIKHVATFCDTKRQMILLQHLSLIFLLTFMPGSPGCPGVPGGHELGH